MRSGTSRRCAAGARSPRASRTRGILETAKKVYRPEVFVEAAKELIAEKKAQRGGLRFRERRIPRADEGVHRRRRVRRTQAECVHRKAGARPEGPAEDRGRQCRRQVTRCQRQRCRWPNPRRPSRQGSAPPPPPRFPRVNAAIDGAIRVLSLIGLGFLKPVVAICRGEDPRAHMRQLWLDLGAPIVAITAFLLLWSQVSQGIQTSLGPDSRSHRGVGTDQGVVGRSPGAA